MNVSMYVCRAYVCIYLSTYVRTYVSIYLSIYVHTYVCMYVGGMYLSIYLSTYVRTYVCMIIINYHLFVNRIYSAPFHVRYYFPCPITPQKNQLILLLVSECIHVTEINVCIIIYLSCMYIYIYMCVYIYTRTYVYTCTL